MSLMTTIKGPCVSVLAGVFFTELSFHDFLSIAQATHFSFQVEEVCNLLSFMFGQLHFRTHSAIKSLQRKSSTSKPRGFSSQESHYPDFVLYSSCATVWLCRAIRCAGNHSRLGSFMYWNKNASWHIRLKTLCSSFSELL